MEKKNGAKDSKKDSATMCLELALEGERLCKSGECRAGIAFFQAAIETGTDDLRTLMAIYSQMGNAHFFLGDYESALFFHTKDLNLSRTINDKAGEAKSCGNLGNTYKLMNNFDEAIMYCKLQLNLSRELGDRNCEGRALYSLGNVYHSKGKSCGRQKDGSNFELSDEAKSYLKEAIVNYLANLEVMNDLGDRVAQGRTCGNLGNTYYLLCDFEHAVFYHKKRLEIAKFFADKAAQRRAHNNLGNCFIFLSNFTEAAHHYKETLSLAIELGDRAIEAQACYSLGNSYTLMRDFETAIEYHLRHLIIAQELSDRVGESRAYWSLSNAYMALDNPQKALYFASKHLNLSKYLNDSDSQKMAKVNVDELEKILQSQSFENEEASKTKSRTNKMRRDSMDQLKLLKLTPDKQDTKKSTSSVSSSSVPSTSASGSRSSGLASFERNVNVAKNDDQNSFFDLLESVQSRRMEEQRVQLPPKNFNASVVQDSTSDLQKEPAQKSTVPDEDFFSLLAKMQSKRMEDQRAEIKPLKKV